MGGALVAFRRPRRVGADAVAGIAALGGKEDSASRSAISPCRPHRRRGGYIFSFRPARMSQALTGQAVKKPRTIDSCISIQYAAVVFGNPGEKMTS